MTNLCFHAITAVSEKKRHRKVCVLVAFGETFLTIYNMPTCDDPMGSRWYFTVLVFYHGNDKQAQTDDEKATALLDFFSSVYTTDNDNDFDITNAQIYDSGKKSTDLIIYDM